MSRKNKKIIYSVCSGEYEDYRANAIFTTKEKAEKYRQKLIRRKIKYSKWLYKEEIEAGEHMYALEELRSQAESEWWIEEDELDPVRIPDDENRIPKDEK